MEIILFVLGCTLLGVGFGWPVGLGVFLLVLAVVIAKEN